MSKMLLRIAAAALMSAGLVQTANAARTGDWPQWGYTARGLRENTHETALTRKTVHKLVLKWSQPIDIGSASPVVANGMLYVGSTNGMFYAFDAVSGTPAWTFKTGFRIEGAAAVADGVVYVGSDDGRLYALDAETGALKWSVIMEGSVEASPVVAHGMVFVANDQGSVFALNAKTGIVKWQAGTGGAYLAVSTPAVAHGLVYAADVDDNMYAFDEATGKTVWTNQLGFSRFVAMPAVDADNVYIATTMNIQAFDARTGSKVWTMGMDETQGSIAVAKGHVYIGTLGHVLWNFDAPTGALVYDTAVNNSIETTPAIANGIVYSGCDDGTIDAYDARTGTKLWSNQFESFDGDRVLSSPAVSNGMVYAGNTVLNAYGLP